MPDRQVALTQTNFTDTDAMFSLAIRTENAAFEDDARDEELARILGAAADKLSSGQVSSSETFALLDINGNKVGAATGRALDDAPELKEFCEGRYSTLEIETDNAAFDSDDKDPEIARVLRFAASQLTAGKTVAILRDGNGNLIGGMEDHAPMAPFTDGSVYVSLEDIGDPKSHDWWLATEEDDIAKIAGRIGLPLYGERWTGVMTSIGESVADQDDLVYVTEADHPKAKDAQYLQVVHETVLLTPALLQEALARTAARQEVKSELSRLFGYYIDLDERGSFRADVRSADDKTVFDIRDGNELGEGESSLFEDGFMRDKHDLAGLAEHLQSLGVIPKDAELLEMGDFEKRVAEIRRRLLDLSDSGPGPEPT